MSDIEDLLRLGRGAEREKAESMFRRLVGMKVLGSLLPGAIVSGAEALYDMYKKIRHQKNLEPDKVADFPVLQALSVEPGLVKVIEDDILQNIDEKYQNYLQTLNPQTKLTDITSINEFIRLTIAKSTDKHVTIQDLGSHSPAKGGDVELPDTADAEEEFFGAKAKPLGEKRA